MQLVILLIAIVLGACTKTPPVKQPAVTVEYQISKDGRALGTLTIVPGQPGTLVATPEGTELEALWGQVLAGKTHITTRSEKRGSDGSREYNSRLYSPGQDDYAEGVGYWLEYEKGFELVKR